MKPITFSSLFVFILFAFPKISLGQINGLSDICIQECAVYEYSTGLGGPYFWQSTGNFKQGNTGEEVEVCWDVIGSNTLTVIDLSAPISSQTATVNIQVAPIPEVEIIFPLYPNCVISDSLDNGTEQEQVLECFTACPSSIGSYRAFNWQGNSLTWVVDGGTIINESNDEVEILWDASGSGFISLSEENTTGCFDSISYCIEILVPVDSDILVFGGGANQIEICKGSTVYFQAISDEGSSFIWDLGNGSVASGINVDETYNAPGNYTVSLISQSSCSCFDTSYYQVIVEDAVSPEIDCVGTVCSSDEQTYTASEVCTSYTWNVSGEGTIVGGGGVGDDFVTVSWNTGPVGTISLSTSGCATSTCDEPVLVQIPIIDGSAQIIGPSEICKSRNARFYIQDYDGTEYYWGIVGNGSIVSGHGTSEIEVQWEDAPWADDTAIIQVEYNNCYLECSGSATLDIELKDEFDVSTNPITCENNSAFLSGVVGWNSANLDWDIVSPSGVLTTYTNESFLNLSGLELGEYNVTAIDAADMYCNSEIQFTFQVVPEPDISSFPLNGPTEICVGEYYNYSLDIYDSKYFMRWTVDDGGSTNFYTSNPIAVQWTSSGPYKLSYRITDQETNCNSETMEVDLFPISSTAISGNNRTCLDAIETYVFTTPSSSNVVWEVIPPTAGSIKQNADNSIDIQWHETGNHQLTTNYCGANLIYNVEVLDLPSAEPVYDSPVCPGELSSVNVPISSGESVEIIDENNALVSSVANSMLPPGIFTVQVFSEEYCIKNYPIVIDSFPISTVRISSPDGNAFCPPHPGVLITALDTKEGYTYEWYRDNVAIGETTDAIMTNIFGTYHVVVTDINGCEIMSNEHTLYEFCGTGSPSDPAPGTGPITFDESYLQCNDLEFTITSSTHSSTSFTWYFDYPNSDPDFISYEENPTFYYPEAGYYYVVVFGNIFPEYGAKVITVPAVSRFKYDVACVGENTQFTDISTFIPAYPITGYEWNFGDVASGSDNTSTLQNPEHNYTVPGFYLVTLTVTSTFGCTSYYEELIEVKEGPDSGIIMPFSSCADRGLEFRALSGSDNFIYAWDFGDPSSGAGNESASQNTIHTFSGNGVYEVTLEVTNVYGCTETYREDITIVSSQMTGDITSSTSFPIL